jgi:hypothetical protein
MAISCPDPKGSNLLAVEPLDTCLIRPLDGEKAAALAIFSLRKWTPGSNARATSSGARQPP